MVRRDSSGLLTLAVDEALANGRELLARAGAIEDEQTFERWRASKVQWIRRTAHMLALEFESEAAAEFMRANITVGTTWEHRLRAERDGIRDSSELLWALYGTLHG